MLDTLIALADGEQPAHLGGGRPGP
jgi:hypothetical protein